MAGNIPALDRTGITRRRFVEQALSVAAGGAVLGLGLDACGSSSAATGPRSLKIAMIFYMEEGQRQKADKKAFEDQTRAQGDLGIVLDSRSDSTLQKTQVEQLITQKVDAAIVWPVAIGTVCPLFTELKNAGIAVIDYNDPVPNCGGADYVISRDNFGQGVTVGKAAIAAVPTGNYVLIGGDPGQAVAQDYHKGWLSVLQPHVDSGDIKIVTDQYTPNWSVKTGLSTAENALIANRNNVHAIIGANDDLALVALQAVKAQKLLGKVWVAGGDADLVAVRSVLQGELAFTVYTPTGNMGKGAAIVARDLATKQPLPPETSKLHLGNSQVDGQLFATVGISKDSVASFVCTYKYYTVASVYNGILPSSQWPQQC